MWICHAMLFVAKDPLCDIYFVITVFHKIVKKYFCYFTMSFWQSRQLLKFKKLSALQKFEKDTFNYYIIVNLMTAWN